MRDQESAVWNLKMKFLALGMVVLVSFLSGVVKAEAHGDDRPMKKGILLVAFGTSVPKAQKVYDRIEARVRAAFPEVEVRWAYTSKTIRKKLAREGKRFDSPSMALARMAEDDFTHAVVQSLHIIPGEEYHHLVRVARAFSGLPKGMKKILVGRPLLAAPADLPNTAKAMIANFPADRKSDEAVILMGHGTHHPGNSMYPAMQFVFWQMDPNVFVGTVEGSPSLDDVMGQIKAKGIKKAWLVPFMSVAGDHAMNDMAGPEPDSWKSILTKAGVECETVLIGMAAYEQVTDIFVEHLQSAMSHFE